ncbi:MAG: hypothetical protein CSB06_02935 [Bacteroidia bacterium]|nr:MAG: hypothetical protein CSB06_02935 [Bacteroidia bacterium]
MDKDREGLMKRYLQEAENWTSHLQHTKDQILQAANKITHKDTCVVLGSGWWLDLPVETLHDTFQRLIFIDISHPKQRRHKALKFPKMELLTVDITGVLESLQKTKKIDSEFIDRIKIPDFNFGLPQGQSPDFVVSANLLSQLACFPLGYALRKRKISGEHTAALQKKIEENHLALLPAGKTCLIVDYYQYAYTFSGKPAEEEPRILCSLPNVPIEKEWIWNFDMSGNYKTARKIKFKVKAMYV